MIQTLDSPTPETVAAAILHGRTLLDGSPAEAADQARHILSFSSNNTDALRLLSAALRRLGDNEGAGQAQLAAIHASDNDPDLVRAGKALTDDDLLLAEMILRKLIAERPDDASATRMLAEVAQRVNRLPDAERLLRVALDLAPGFLFARMNLAAVLHSLNRSGEALDELDIVRRAEGDFDDTLQLRAEVLVAIGDYDEAIAIYRDLLTRDPENWEMWMSIGHLHKTVGAQGAAVAGYRRVLQIAAMNGEAWWSLANLKTFTFDEADIAAMQAALARHDLSESDRLRIHFALGQAFEDRGETDRSFGHFVEGNRIRDAQLDYEPTKVTALVEASENLFTRKFLSARAGQGCSAPDPIFILGLPRSGSTLVEQILASHPAIEGTAELADIIALARSLDTEPASLGEAWNNYPALLAELAPDQLHGLGELYLDRTRVQRKTDRPRFIDKMPNNWVHVGFIRLILPNAKIIDARRHPFACGYSNFKQQFARGQEFSYNLANFGQYYRDYVRLMDHFDAVAPGAVHRVIHERLVADPEGEIRRLLDYLALPFEPACLLFHENRRPVHTASSQQVRRPLSAGKLELWRSVEPHLEPLKAALGAALDNWDLT